MHPKLVPEHCGASSKKMTSKTCSSQNVLKSIFFVGKTHRVIVCVCVRVASNGDGIEIARLLMQPLLC